MGFVSWQTLLRLWLKRLCVTSLEEEPSGRQEEPETPWNHPSDRKISKTQHKQTAEDTNHERSRGLMDICQKGQGWPRPSVAMTLWCQGAPLGAPTALHARRLSALHFLLESNRYPLCFAPHPKGNCDAALGRSFPPMGGCHGCKWTEHTEYSGLCVLAIQMHL